MAMSIGTAAVMPAGVTGGGARSKFVGTVLRGGGGSRGIAPAAMVGSLVGAAYRVRFLAAFLAVDRFFVAAFRVAAFLAGAFFACGAVVARRAVVAVSASGAPTEGGRRGLESREPPAARPGRRSRSMDSAVDRVARGGGVAAERDPLADLGIHHQRRRRRSSASVDGDSRRTRQSLLSTPTGTPLADQVTVTVTA